MQGPLGRRSLATLREVSPPVCAWTSPEQACSDRSLRAAAAEAALHDKVEAAPDPPLGCCTGRLGGWPGNHGAGTRGWVTGGSAASLWAGLQA